MRRVLTIVGAMAAMAVLSSQAMAAHTAAEVHVFFGSGLVNPALNPDGSVIPAPAEVTAISSQVTTAGPGAMVVFPIWMRVLPGDGANSVSAFGFRVFNEGTTASFSPVAGGAGNDSRAVYPLTSQFIAAGAGSGASHPTIAALKEFRSATFSQVIAVGQNLGLGMYFLGWMKVQVSPTAHAGDRTDFSFSVGTGDGSRNIAFANAGSLTTVAFGGADAANGSGGLNTYRRGNTNADVLGANSDNVSSLADASIIVPEPATIGLLALGLLGIRRRRSA